MPTMEALPCLNSPDVEHYGQPVALVVADTFENARAAANLVDVAYESQPGRFEFESFEDQARPPQRVPTRATPFIALAWRFARCSGLQVIVYRQKGSRRRVRSSTPMMIRIIWPIRSIAMALNSRRSGSMLTPARSDSDGCLGCSRQAAF